MGIKWVKNWIWDNRNEFPFELIEQQNNPSPPKKSKKIKLDFWIKKYKKNKI